MLRTLDKQKAGLENMEAETLVSCLCIYFVDKSFKAITWYLTHLGPYV